jgi:hypothetical protein
MMAKTTCPCKPSSSSGHFRNKSKFPVLLLDIFHILRPFGEGQLATGQYVALLGARSAGRAMMFRPGPPEEFAGFGILEFQRNLPGPRPTRSHLFCANSVNHCGSLVHRCIGGDFLSKETFENLPSFFPGWPGAPSLYWARAKELLHEKQVLQKPLSSDQIHVNSNDRQYRCTD